MPQVASNFQMKCLIYLYKLYLNEHCILPVDSLPEDVLEDIKGTFLQS